MATVRAVLLDLGDTLLGLDPLPAQDAMASRVSDALQAASVRDWDRLSLEIVHRLAADGARRSREGSPDEADLPGLIAGVLGVERTAPEVTLVDRVFGDADVERFRDGHAAIDALQALRAMGLKLVVVSNTTTPEAVLRGSAVAGRPLSMVDAAVFSRELGHRKPGEAIYRAALAHAGVEAAAAVMVGDRMREDVGGPQRLGMRGVLTRQFRSDPAVAGSAPDGVVDHLDALPRLIERFG